MRPSVDFYTGEEPDESKVGIKIMNDGPGPGVIKKITYYVDRKEVRDSDEALSYGKIDKKSVLFYEFDADDVILVNEEHRILYRVTNNKKDLDKFLDFIEINLAVEVIYCSIDGAYRTKCSIAGRCQ